MSIIGATNILDMASDKVTHALSSVSIDEKKIHTGKAYSVSHSEDSIAIGGKFYFQINTSDDAIFLKDYYIFASNSNFIVRMYEDPDNDPVGGTVLTAINRDRDSANTSAVVVKENVTPDLTGATLIEIKDYATISKEFVLAPLTTYLIEIENLHTDTININALLYWYES